MGLQQALSSSSKRDSAGANTGSKATLSDYIPGFYIRLQRGKWYLQTEFSFHTPQPVRPFSFSQTTRYDVAGNTLGTERFAIQKLYYHQLPLTVNYYVTPHVAVGTGVVYNRLAEAITEREVRTVSILTGAETVSKNIVPVKGYKDSFLYKSTVGLLVQTDYHWKRLSFGLRYMQNLQPFIKYTRPDGEVLDEKSKALQVILRFKLF